MTSSLSQASTPPAGASRESLGQRLDPRRHIAAAVGWAVFVLVTVGALVAAELAASTAEREMRADTQARLGQAAGQAADALVARVQVLLSALQASAAQWPSDGAAASSWAERLQALQRAQPVLGWIGLRDAQGRLLAATGGLDAAPPGALQGHLEQALRAPQLILHRAHAADEDDALVLTVPLAGAGAPPAGVLVAQLPWLWLQAELDARLRALAGGAPLQLLLLDAQGRLLAGPPQLRDGVLLADPSEHGRYLVGRPPDAADAGGPAGGAGWQLVVREDAASALARARETRRAVLLGVLGVGLLAALAVVGVAHRPLRRLRTLAQQARAVQGGQRPSVAVPAGRDEVHAIGQALAELIDHLQAEKAALAQLNTELDARVAARTARIERLAQDARRAAVTRERLRLARGLHDTLAHSLMALLTQIRLMRKLGPRWSAEQWDAELAEAEQAATRGLAEARAAIGQMRQAGVHDSGLGPELQALLQRFAERSAVAAVADIDPAAADLVDERAAAVLSIAREALRNVQRHAQARQVRLALQPERLPPADSDEPARWRLTLVDDGVGFDVQRPREGHFGLMGLHEQAEQLGAELTLDSAPGQGCRLQLRFAA
ncbi:MAG: histidine kinase [Burkholderiaceae bacterium]